MRRPRLVPGEKEEVSLHPAFASYLPWHLLSLLPAAAGIGLWLLLRSDAWAAGSQGSPWRFWNYLYGNPWAADAYTLTAFVAAGLLGAWTMKRRWPAIAVAGAGLTVVTTAETAAPAYHADALPLLVGILTAPALLLCELERRSRTIHLTNLRLVAHGGLVRKREENVHYDAIADIDWRRGALARTFAFATPLIILRKPVPGAPEPRFPGFRPYPRLRAVLEALIQRATTGEVLREAAGVERRAREAVVDLHRDGPRSERL